MKNALIWLFAFTLSKLCAQEGHFGITANFGFSRTGTLQSELAGFDNPWAFSGHGGLYWEKESSLRFRLGAALLFAQIEGCETHKGQELRFAEPDPFFPSGARIDTKSFYHYSYLALRPYAQLLLNRLHLGLGIQPMWLLASSYEDRRQITFPGLPDKILDRKGGTFNEVSHLDIAPVVEAGYRISRRFQLQATYFQGLVPILNKAEGSNIANRQATLGLGFCLTCRGNEVVKGLGG